MRCVEFLEDVFDVIWRRASASLAGADSSLALPAAFAEVYAAFAKVDIPYAVLHVAPVLVVEAVHYARSRIEPFALPVVELAGAPGPVRQAAIFAQEIPGAAEEGIFEIPIRIAGADHSFAIAE